MLKICDCAIFELLSIMFNNCINHSMFPDIWKQSNIFPIHKRGDQKIISNYRPVSFLRICEKIFERLIFNCLYEHGVENKLLSMEFSYYRLFITYTRILMLTQILKLVVCFWICIKLLTKSGWRTNFKLRSAVVSDSLSKIIEGFLHNRFQRFLLNGQESEWTPVKTSVPQVFNLVSLFF